MNGAKVSSVVNKVNNEGETALHIAVKHGNLDVVKVLLADDGANVTAVDILDRAPLNFTKFDNKNGSHNAAIELLRLSTKVEEASARAVCLNATDFTI